MALGAAKRQTQPGGAGGGHAIGHGMKTELERVDTALLVDHGIAVKTGGNNPLLTRAR